MAKNWIYTSLYVDKVASKGLKCYFFAECGERRFELPRRLLGEIDGLAENVCHVSQVSEKSSFNDL